MFSYIKRKFNNAKTNLYISHEYEGSEDMGDVVFEGSGADIHIIASKFKSIALGMTPEHMRGIDDSVIFDVSAINSILPKFQDNDEVWHNMRPMAACYLIDKLSKDEYEERGVYKIKSDQDTVRVSILRSNSMIIQGVQHYIHETYTVHEGGLITSKRAEV